MELLDAAVALAITLAVLATTVTVFMEIWIRFLGLKSKTQVELFQKIFDNAVKDKFPGVDNQWNFIEKVLRNPLLGGKLHQPKSGDKIRYIGIRSRGIYEWVSDEHVYLHLLDMQGALSATKDELVIKLKQFSRKYDEYCAAASVEFKEDRRRASIIAGVLLALVFNIDGVRIFNEYVKYPELAASMAAKADELEKTAQRVEARLEAAIENPENGNIDVIEARLTELRSSISELETAGVPIGWHYPPHCFILEVAEPKNTATGNAGDDGSGQGSANQGNVAGSSIKTNACRLESDRKGGQLLLIGSVIAMLGTGVLIGLGAPFWFDVARRLAEVRSFFGGKGGGEAAYNGETAGMPQQGKTKSEQTDALINRVVEEAMAEQRPSGVRRLLVERRKT